MTLKEYIKLFQTKLERATKKSEVRTFKKFVAILTDLEKRSMEELQKEAIEKELNRLLSASDPKLKKKSFTRKLGIFTTFLQNNYSLVPQGHYTSLGMIMGMTMGTSFGIAIGAIFDPATGIAIGLSIGTGIGMAIGMAIGAVKDKEALAQGRVINVKYEC